MRKDYKRQPIRHFVLLLVCGLPFSASLAAEKSPANYQAVAEQCITQSLQSLEERGILPSEESAVYDTEFDAVYKECMAARGMPEEPTASEEESFPPSAVLQ